jgi:hypothetical protein
MKYPLTNTQNAPFRHENQNRISSLLIVKFVFFIIVIIKIDEVLHEPFGVCDHPCRRQAVFSDADHFFRFEIALSLAIHSNMFY